MLQESVDGMFPSESALNHTSRKSEGIAGSPGFQPALTPSLTTGTRTLVTVDAGGHHPLCLCPRCQRGGQALAHSQIETFSCMDSDGNAGTLTKALIHPLWFCLQKVLDQAVNHSSVITVLVCSAFNCLSREKGCASFTYPRLLLLLCSAELAFK